MASKKAKSETLRITADHDAERPVVMHPDSNDLFVRTGRQVIADSQLGISLELWIDEFNNLLAEVERWAEERHERVVSCFCAPRGTKFVFFFSPASPGFDFDLADQLSELNLHLCREYNVGNIEVHQIPWDEAGRFVRADTDKRVFGREISTS